MTATALPVAMVAVTECGRSLPGELRQIASDFPDRCARASRLSIRDGIEGVVRPIPAPF